MNTIQAKFSSPRFLRVMYGVGALILAAGTLALVSHVIGGSDKTTFGPDQGFRATLPEHSDPLKNANGKTIRTFWQLDPQIRSTIHLFLATAVARKHLAQSWDVIAPSVKSGYTRKQWSTADALPVIPYPIANVDAAQYYLDYASTKEILIEVGVAAGGKAKIRPTAFQLGLVPVGQGTHTRWLVDYWMPRWTPPLPVN